MPCNCNKKKSRPFGPSTASTASTKAGDDGKKFVLRTLKGTTVYGSRLEAEAAKRRAGGGQITSA